MSSDEIVTGGREAAREAAPAEYEAPKVERVMTPEDLAREIQYAGISAPG
jgi:hypothetical protein